MSKTTALHLPDPYFKMVQNILQQHVPTAQVWAYGSRVRGDHFEASDLDLVVRQPQQLTTPTPQLPQLREAFSDSALPLLVQVVDWAQIPDAFHREILDSYAVVQAGNAL